ncbi:MAG: peroxiredoxin family protein [Muribaculaceae bacterium]|nr:peroxiredoxin family protein [Muribaculaceae bacterium]
MIHSIKHTILLGALLLGLIVASAGVGTQPSDTAVGRKAPVVQLGNVQSAINAEELKGKYVLISFWDSSDAASREACNRYNAWFNANHPSDACFVGINFDDSAEMFNEIVRRDSLNPSDQYRVGRQEAEAIYRTYHLEKGYGSLVVSPQGRIVCHNPGPEELDQIFS